MRNLFFIIVVFYAVVSFGQNNAPEKNSKIDSLILKTKSAKNDTSKVILFNKIARELMYKEPERALAYCDSAELLSKKNKYLRGLARSNSNKGIYYKNASNYDMAFKCLVEAVKIAEQTNDHRMMAAGYTNLGNLFKSQGNLEKSLEYHLMAKKECEITKDKSAMAISLQNIGVSYRRLKKTDEAIEASLEAFKIYEELKDNDGIMSVYNTLGGVYIEELKQYDKGLVYFLKMKELVEKSDDSNAKSLCYQNLGMTYYSLKNYKLAKEFTLKAIDFMKPHSNLEREANNYLNLSSIIELEGNSKEALALYKKYFTLKDSLNKLQNKRSTLELEEKFHSEKSKKEIELLSNVNDLKTKENEQQKNELQKNKIVMILSILVGIIITVLAFVAFKNLRRSNKLNSLLSTSNDQINYQKKEILDSIMYARRIQDSILPHPEELHKTLKSHFIIYKPRNIVSGDFYWTYFVDKTGTKQQPLSVVGLCDCTGHGVPGAFMSLISYTILNQIIRTPEVKSTDAVLNDLSKELPYALKSEGKNHDLHDGLDLAIVAINYEEMTLQCSMAHIPVYICDGKELKYFAPDKQSISADNYDPNFKFTQQNIKLKKGERIYLATDGFADQFGGEKGKKIKYKQLEQLIFETYHLPLHQQKIKIEDFFDSWRGNLEQVDDVTLIGIEV